MQFKNTDSSIINLSYLCGESHLKCLGKGDLFTLKECNL